MFFSWLKRRRRDKLKSRPFPPQWKEFVEKHLWQYRALNGDERKKLENSIAILFAEKNWEGCNDLELNDLSKVAVAAQVGLLTLGLGEEYFDNVMSVLIYPSAYRAESQVATGGVVMATQSDRLGEAWYRGPVILSLPDVFEGASGPNHARNLVFHEFAHQLDMLNSSVADGIPPMESSDQAEAWISNFRRAYQQQVHDCQTGHRPLVDRYGATNEAEFFAVLTEAFFQTPKPLSTHDPDLYDVLRTYYRQDPLRWAH
ncbi:M90 family metallopeptidase [Blastopirellula retiformator]|uniref:Protein MtfA n=1 Tax=Blastopirellula retiformator TaxID=2527970 RepID=A0A5C5V740_9BACT|nr:M90 family metallopeptidase [Blastopirellula retiformator]TWT34388.1 Protein MtfA [Blastopirellula retiformator]